MSTQKAKARFCSCMPNPNPLDILTRSSGKKSGQRAVFLTNTAWNVGETIRIAFMGGTLEQRRHVQKVASEWLQYANLKFKWNVPVQQSDVRIAFDTEDGSWSYMGRQSRSIDTESATMNFGWLSERPSASERGTILHEFGHLLGLGHEHQNPKGGLTWKRDVVIESLSGEPNNWSVDTIESNVLEQYTEDDPDVFATDFDPKGIMLYYFPAEWNEQGVATNENEELSNKDKATIAQMYPYENGQDWEINLNDADEGNDGDRPDNSSGDNNNNNVDEAGCFGGCARALNAFARALAKRTPRK